MSAPTPRLDRVAQLARAAWWIETLGPVIESNPTPDDTWFRVCLQHSGETAAGTWVFGDLVEAVRSCVEASGRDWHQPDHLLFQ